MSKAFRAVAAVFVLGALGTGCDANEPLPGYEAGRRFYVSTPASGSNAQGRTPTRADSNQGAAQFASRNCYYPDVIADSAARREKIAECTNTTLVGAGEGQGGGAAH